MKTMPRKAYNQDTGKPYQIEMPAATVVKEAILKIEWPPEGLTVKAAAEKLADILGLSEEQKTVENTSGLNLFRDSVVAPLFRKLLESRVLEQPGGPRTPYFPVDEPPVAFLEKIHIKNFLSLRDVTLPLKPLTVLVGPNASGKSNVLSALSLLKAMTRAENLPPTKLIQDSLWAGEARKISFDLHTKANEDQTLYNLEVEAKPDSPYQAEQLSVNGKNVIFIQNGQGSVWDENGEGETQYNSNELALRSAGNYGHKPTTRALTEFIKEWQFYNFDTDYIRLSLTESSLADFIRGNLAESSPAEKEIGESPKLDSFGRNLPEVLWEWYENSPENFQNVSDSLALSTNLEIDHCTIDGQKQLCLLEGYEKPIQLRKASEGTLRLIAYYILLNEPELPPLIAIEEPERNLHPGALTDIAPVLEQIAERSQVIITTHSSQLLDAFNPESLSDSLGILLLHNHPGVGTEAHNLEDYRGKREALEGWIADFGIGSAIFDSGLLQDVMEDKSECRA